MIGQTPRSLAIQRNRQHVARVVESDARAERHWDHERKHYVYRCYDVDDRLLYVGCTHDIGSRMQVHASSWHNPVSAYLTLRMTRCEVEEPPYIGRLAGRAAEKAAIETEAPLLNQHHNKGRGLRGAALDRELQRTKPDPDPLVAGVLDAWLEGWASRFGADA